MHHGLRNQVEPGLSVIEFSRLSFTRGLVGRLVRDCVSLPRERVAEQFQLAEDEVGSLIRFMSSVNFAALPLTFLFGKFPVDFTISRMRTDWRSVSTFAARSSHL